MMEFTGRPTRRRMLQGSIALAVLTCTGAGLAEAQQKAKQKMVQYQDKPKGTQECDGCVQWVAPDQCKLVEGPIKPKGWCALFAPKPKTTK